eukprot:8241203-Prorocentrum_lima.AAC.1
MMVGLIVNVTKEEFPQPEDHDFVLAVYFPHSALGDQLTPTMMEVENQNERAKPGTAIYSDIRENPLGEFDDSCYWEIGLLSGCPTD